MSLLFLKGFFIGLSIAAPVGPIGALCIQRSLHAGFKIGLLTGLGAATADAVYALLAGLGLTMLSAWLIAGQFWIRILGGLFLLYLGIKLLRTHRRVGATDTAEQPSPWKTYATTFILTLTNPKTILSFTAIFAGVGVGKTGADYAQASCFVAGVALGSAFWWILLSGCVAFLLRHALGEKGTHLINLFSGFVMLAFSVSSLWAALRNAP